MQIKKHVPGRTYGCSHFFVLAVGQNTGKPSYSPWRNCFVVQTQSPEEAHHLYWLFFALWQGSCFKRALRGSVIPFVPLSEVKKIVVAVYRQVPVQQEQLQVLVLTLQQVADLQCTLQSQLRSAVELQRVLVSAFLNKKSPQ